MLFLDGVYVVDPMGRSGFAGSIPGTTNADNLHLFIGQQTHVKTTYDNLLLLGASYDFELLVGEAATNPVSLPAAVWLFGSALAGFWLHLQKA